MSESSPAHRKVSRSIEAGVLAAAALLHPGAEAAEKPLIPGKDSVEIMQRYEKGRIEAIQKATERFYTAYPKRKKEGYQIDVHDYKVFVKTKNGETLTSFPLPINRDMTTVAISDIDPRLIEQPILASELPPVNLEDSRYERPVKIHVSPYAAATLAMLRVTFDEEGRLVGDTDTRVYWQMPTDPSLRLVTMRGSVGELVLCVKTVAHEQGSERSTVYELEGIPGAKPKGSSAALPDIITWKRLERTDFPPDCR